MSPAVLDVESSTVVQIEVITGIGTSAIGGQPMLTNETYVFLDYEFIDGALTPFGIDRFINGLKIEETRFVSVEYNAGIPDDAFR